MTEKLYERELSRHYRVLTCHDEDEALRLVCDEDIRAVVMEPALSDGAGWRLMEDVRTIRPEPPLPFVFYSALDERRRGMSQGAAAYLVKPVLPATLLDVLRQVLQA